MFMSKAKLIKCVPDGSELGIELSSKGYVGVRIETATGSGDKNTSDFRISSICGDEFVESIDSSSWGPLLRAHLKMIRAQEPFFNCTILATINVVGAGEYSTIMGILNEFGDVEVE